jgi:FlaA1/EpsC-like NDP-sugar epimerase
MWIEGKRALVTGGTGSFGQFIVRRLLDLGVEEIRILSRDEKKHYDMRHHYSNEPRIRFITGDIRDERRVRESVYGCEVVFQAAALKHVYNCEEHPYEAVMTNIIGTQNVISAAVELGVQRLVTLSTDKAVKPVNVMGMTKSIQERIFARANLELPHTRIVIVRYGNVLASRGSVVPLFHDQIRNGGPVTITVPEMTRFLLSLDQAVDTVCAALHEARPGETYVPRVPAATVINIARALIGQRQIETVVTGIRPGEKMHEILVSEEECHHTVSRGRYYAIRPMLPELRTGSAQDEQALQREFSSGDDVLDAAGTFRLLREHKLLPEDIDTSATGELLR